jgi:hypothetical protein
VPPTTVFAVRFRSSPSQIGLLDPRVKAAGVALIVTETVPAGPVHPFTVAVTLYVPASAAVTPVTVGFCWLEVKPFGLDQLYVAPAILDAVRLRLSPSHNGALLPAVGAMGIGSTTTVTSADGPTHPFRSGVTV